MSSLTANGEFLDVTTLGIQPDLTASRGGRPVVSPDPTGRGRSNVQRFRDAIATLRARNGAVGGVIRSGIIYLPPGRYRVENEPQVEWRENLWALRSTAGTADLSTWKGRRNENPLGAVLVFPADITLWLAPGAVLVPDPGAIIDISSALTCEPTEIFDTTRVDDTGIDPRAPHRRGTIVFGTRVAKVLADWWGVYPGEDHQVTLQAAIDAGIHDRSNGWEVPSDPGPSGQVTRGIVVIVRPPIPVELRGVYTVRSTVEVRVGQRNNAFWLLGNRNFTNFTDVPSGAPEIVTNAVIAGAGGGRLQQGTRIVTSTAIGAVLRLLHSPGVSIRRIGLEVSETEGSVCLEIIPQDGLNARHGISRTGAFAGINVRGCIFSGTSTALVRVGPRVDLVVPGDAMSLPVQRPSNLGADISLLCFDHCVFRPATLAGFTGNVAAEIRASESLPIRFLACDFVGMASAMISGRSAFALFDGCRFQTVLPPRSPPAAARGFEPPDGSDVYLRYEPQVASATGLPFYVPSSALFSFTAHACVSRSRQFLSSATPIATIPQYLQRSVLLFSVRHLPPASGPPSFSVRWGMKNDPQSHLIMQMGMRPLARLGHACPLVIVGGQYGGGCVSVYNATESSIIGARTITGNGKMALSREVLNPGNPSQFFGLPDDRDHP